MITVVIISIFIIIALIVIYSNNKQERQTELEIKQEEERINKEEWSQKMVEAKKQKQGRIQMLLSGVEEQKLKKQEEERKAKEEWAQKMAEARRLKKLEKEKKEEERRLQLEKTEEERILYYEQLQDDFKKIGADIIWEKKGLYLTYYVTTFEDVDLDVFFKLFNKVATHYSDNKFRIPISERVCYIKDLNGNDLIKISPSTEEWEIYFNKEEKTKVFDKENFKKQSEDYLLCYLENRKIKRLEEYLETIILNGINQAPKLLAKGISIEEKICSALESSNYEIDFRKEIESIREKDMLVVDYELPNMSNLSEVKEYKYIATSKEIRTKAYTESYIAKRYENVLYSITLRSLYEIFSIDTENEINGVTFNGFVTQVNPATGIIERKCILSLQVDRQKFSQINLSQVEPKACFKALKGVSAAKLIDISPITPILTFNKKDKRFVEGKDVSVNKGTNLAAMHWEDFEHLVRELFEMEFARNGGEVRVTQASRDGGVDAIVFDPDPLRGGKIVIQAKRYTNTVGVSAVRDLYGTVINEGANSGILITTSDYGHDSYEFAKDKPLKLLNGGHLLALLYKNGRTAHINIEEAKKINEK